MNSAGNLYEEKTFGLLIVWTLGNRCLQYLRSYWVRWTKVWRVQADSMYHTICYFVKKDHFSFAQRVWGNAMLRVLITLSLLKGRQSGALCRTIVKMKSRTDSSFERRVVHAMDRTEKQYSSTVKNKTL